ncbi:hypothetical protein FQN49_003091 [Arthroderma sp. PD_2]|nr:hypothetical protein FQN49_003091 [Arthroderma sp. PD_2]
MELGYGDQDLIYEEEARRLAESAPVPRPMCLTCSKRIAEAPMLQCPQAHPLSKCTQCAETNKPCLIVPSQFRGDLERIQDLAREYYVTASKRVSKRLQESVKKYVTAVETYECKGLKLEEYSPYEVPRATILPVPIPSPDGATQATTPTNSPNTAEETSITSPHSCRDIGRMLNSIAEYLAKRSDLPSEEENGVGKDLAESAWLAGNGLSTNGKPTDATTKQEL